MGDVKVIVVHRQFGHTPVDIIFGTMVGWGTQYNQDNDVLRVSVTPQQGDHQEWLIYKFEALTGTSATLLMHWSTTIVPVTIALP